MPDRTCAVDGCDRSAHAGCWCGKHYHRWKSTGDPLKTLSGRVVRAPGVQCSVEGCETEASVRDWCKSHYDRWRNSGDPNNSLSGKRRGVYRTCRIEGCDVRQNSHSLCRPHYRAVVVYNVTPEWFETELAKGCAVCGDLNATRYAVDHDHMCCPGAGSCGKCVRGVLCQPCNVGLGSFRDDPVRLRAAIEYLGR